MKQFKEYLVTARVHIAMTAGCEPNHLILSDVIEDAVRKAAINLLVGPVSIESQEVKGDAK